MKFSLTLPLALVVLATSGVALGQAAPQADPQAAPQTREPPGRPAAMTKEQATMMADRAFERLDINHDGKLSEADRVAEQKAMFERLDTDGNGSISLAEYEAARGERREARAERGDEPGAQQQAPGARLADRRADRRADRDRADGRRGAGFGGRGGPGGPGGLAMLARGADADKDGAVSKQEFRTAFLARFDAADANHDGSITPDERRGMRGGGQSRETWRGMPPRAPAG